MVIFTVLIYVISFVLQPLVLLNIHNQCQDVNLTSPVYFINGGEWCVAPDQKIDVDAVVKNYLEFDSEQDMLEGALIYRIQRRETSFFEIERKTQRKRVKIDKSAQDESKHIQLLIAWHGEYTKGLHVRALLVEHDKEFDEDELRQLHQKCWHPMNAFVNPIEDNWLLDDAAVLTTTVKTMNGGCRWDVLITEGIEDNVERPLWIDAER
jgi:hypothetical protein